jgi:tRNA-specific 2-thiouridylase
MARVVVAMSGGVDSSVAALVLKLAGHDVIGLFMRHGEEPAAACATGGVPAAGLPIVGGRLDHKQGCCSAADAQDARRVADGLDVPFYALDFTAEFGRIKDYFVREYAAGRTPNPCVMCNTWLKFGRLLDYADSVGADGVATGHYVTLRPAADGATPALCRGRDPAKDQSYALFGIDRRALERVRFPVGGHRKEDIRRLAREAGLRVAEKRDSQEICFVPDGDHGRFVRSRLPQDLAGEIVTTAGAVVGRHGGLERFTVGQRKGLGVALGRPQFVVRLEPATRRVVIGDREELGRREITAASANWLIDEPAGPLRCHVQVRYQGRPLAAQAEALAGGRLRALLDQPCHGVSPGQALVLYDGDRVLGGGWIE